MSLSLVLLLLLFLIVLSGLATIAYLDAHTGERDRRLRAAEEYSKARLTLAQFEVSRDEAELARAADRIVVPAPAAHEIDPAVGNDPKEFRL